MNPPTIDHYEWAGGREAMLRFGPPTGLVVVVAMPLLEEWNRTRAFTVTLLRALADRGVASVLPDLPGHGESLFPTEHLTVPLLIEALDAATERMQREGHRTIGLALRSGALLDRDARHTAHWHLSPVSGPEMLAGLHRIWLADRAGKREMRTLDAMLRTESTVGVAGTVLSGELLASLQSAEPRDCAPLRVVRLATDPRPADFHVDGKPLWRLAEPGNDPVLANHLAHDIAAWIMTCDV